MWGGKSLFGGGVLVTAVFTLITPWAAKTSIYFFVIVRVIMVRIARMMISLVILRVWVKE